MSHFLLLLRNSSFVVLLLLTALRTWNLPFFSVALFDFDEDFNTKPWIWDIFQVPSLLIFKKFCFQEYVYNRLQFRFFTLLLNKLICLIFFALVVSIWDLSIKIGFFVFSAMVGTSPLYRALYIWFSYISKASAQSRWWIHGMPMWNSLQSWWGLVASPKDPWLFSTTLLRSCLNPPR